MRSAAITILSFILPVVLVEIISLPVSGAAALRLRIEPVANSPWPAKVGVCEIAASVKGDGHFHVFTAEGKPVASEVFWSAAGGPVAIRFDTSGGARVYEVCLDTDLPPVAANWQPQAGVLLETRACPGRPVRTAGEAALVLSAAGPVFGRGYVPEIFLGFNPFGPSTFYTATFSGWFNAYTTGNYSFAIVSSGAANLKIDGHPVVEWPGIHSPNQGRHGQHHGEIHLAAGLHQLEYAQIQFDGEVATEVAWQPPGADHYVVMAAESFLSVARFRAKALQTAAAPELLYFDVRTVEQCALGDAMALRVYFRVVDNHPSRTYRWRFDDGGEAEGRSPEHFFAQPGWRRVTLVALENGVGVATNTVRLRLAPNWSQRDWWRDDLFNEAKNDFLHRDLSQMPAGDLAAIVTLANRADDRELLTCIGKVMVQRAGEFSSAADRLTFYQLGLGFQHQSDAGDVLADKAFRLALALGQNSDAVADQVKLRLADLLIDCEGNFDAAETLLGEMRGGYLTGDELRLQKLLAGDLLLARGKIEEARKQYLAGGGRMNRKTIEVTAAAQLESANILIEHGQLDDARQVLDRLLFKFPIERLSPGTGLLAIQLALKQKEFQRAFTGCQRLLPVAENNPRLSQMLYALAESGFALGKNDDARRALTRLLKEFPYSEGAAKAKEKWPK